MRDYDAELARCDREIAEAVAYDGPDNYGAGWGELDWRTERWLIEQEQAEAK